jgi:uncharacterized membrane protein YgdD (TMEM256/DUF423 family)
VVLGAFGAHALKSRLGADALQLWHTAVQYHFWHALALLAISLAGAGPWFRTAAWLMILGVLLFAGSLYGLALGAPRPLGIVTPIGGLALILGWLAFAVAAIRGS